MNDKINNYLDKVCKKIKCRSLHPEIREELQNHIEEIQSDYIEEGYAEDEALEIAIQAMGDCNETGILLNAQHKTQTDWGLIILLAVFSVLGGVTIYLGGKTGILPVASFERYLVYVFIGSIILISLYFFNYQKLRGPLYLIAVLLSVASIFYGVEAYGKCYLSYGPYTVSCEYIIILYLISLSGIADKSWGRGSEVGIKPVILAVLSVGLTFLSVGLGQGAILTGAYLCLYAVRKMTRGKLNKEVIIAMALVLIGFSGAVIWGIFQVGIFKLHVHNPATNQAFRNLILLFGEAAGGTFVATVAVFILWMFGTIRLIRSRGGFHLALTAGLVLTVQFGINILSNLNILPQGDINLPFISYGGTGFICNMVLVGIILSVWRRNNLISSKDNQN